MADQPACASRRAQIGARSLCDLPFVRRLDLSGNNISRIPLSDTCFPELRDVSLSRTALVGPMPRWITRTQTQLRRVDVEDNAFTYPQASHRLLKSRPRVIKTATSADLGRCRVLRG